MANLFDNATGFEVLDPNTGQVLNSGTFDALGGAKTTLTKAGTALGGIQPGAIGNPAGDYNPFATDPLTGKNDSTPTGNAPAPDFAGWFSGQIGRIVIIMLGFIFVAVGLFLFHENVVTVEQQ